jgi:hypothetical protein
MKTPPVVIELRQPIRKSGRRHDGLAKIPKRCKKHTVSRGNSAIIRRIRVMIAGRRGACGPLNRLLSAGRQNLRRPIMHRIPDVVSPGLCPKLGRGLYYLRLGTELTVDAENGERQGFTAALFHIQREPRGAAQFVGDVVKKNGSVGIQGIFLPGILPDHL